jgi:hypothetical protein
MLVVGEMIEVDQYCGVQQRLVDSSTHELIADEDKSEWKNWKVDFRSHNLGLGARWGTSPSVHELRKWGEILMELENAKTS